MPEMYFKCRWMVRQYCSIFQNVVVNYHLVVSYPQQCHIGIDLKHCCVVVIAMHIVLLFGFVREELSDIMKNKRIGHLSNVMSKRHSIFTKNFTIVLSKLGK